MSLKTFLILLVVWSFASDVLSYFIRGKTVWNADTKPFQSSGISLGANDLFGYSIRHHGQRHDFRYRNYEFRKFPLTIIYRLFADIELGAGVAFEGLHFFMSHKSIKGVLQSLVFVFYGLVILIPGTRLFSAFHFHHRKGNADDGLKAELRLRLMEKPF